MPFHETPIYYSLQPSPMGAERGHSGSTSSETSLKPWLCKKEHRRIHRSEWWWYLPKPPNCWHHSGSLIHYKAYVYIVEKLYTLPTTSDPRDEMLIFTKQSSTLSMPSKTDTVMVMLLSYPFHYIQVAITMGHEIRSTHTYIYILLLAIFVPA